MKRDEREQDYVKRMLLHVFQGEPSPGKPPRRISRTFAEIQEQLKASRADRERRDALHAAHLAAGGTDESWSALGVRAEQAASRATHGDYTRELVTDILEAEVIG